jgi:hypothetical protein
MINIKKMTKSCMALLFAFEKGYSIREDGTPLNPKGKILSQRKSSDGYRSILVVCFGSKYNVAVHRLQAYQIYGDKLFQKGIEVRHVDGDKENNSVKNIAIGTHSENMMDKPENMRKKWALNAGLKKSPLTPADVVEIKKLYKTGEYTYLQLAKIFGLKSKGTISDIINHKVWTHVE